MARKRKKPTIAEEIAQIPLEEVVRLGGPEGTEKIRSYVKKMAMGYKRRVQSFKRLNLHSFAQQRFEESLTGNEKPIRLMNRNQLIHEFARYANFFNSTTARAEEITRIEAEQDARLFGQKKTGSPKRRMTRQERSKFWNIYSEFINQNPTADSKYGSETVQQQLAEMTVSGEWDDGDIIGSMEKAEQRMQEKLRRENIERKPNVYSGRGPTVE